MKRPLCVVGITALVSLFLLCQADNVYLTMGICALFSVLFAVSIRFKFKLKTALLPTVFASVTAVCLLLFVFSALNYYPALSFVQTNGEITATVTQYPTLDNNRYHCIAKIKNEKSNRSFKIRLSFSRSSYYDDDFESKISSLQPGDTVSFVGTVYKLGGENKDAENSFKSKGIFLGAYPTGEVSVLKAQKMSLLSVLKLERRKTINQLLTFFDSETASIGISVLLGEKSYLSNETYENFQNAGVAHIMAVSGLHLSVWILFIMRIIEKAGLDKRKWALFLMAFTSLIMCFAMFSGSVLRAGLMMFLYLLSFVLRQNADSLNSLGFSAVVILLINPYASLNVSFILSFVSTLSIIVVAVPLCEKSDRYFEKLTNTYVRRFVSAVFASLFISFSVSVFTAPFVSLYFGKISLLSPLTNLLFLPAVTPLIVSFGLFIMFYFVPVLSDVLHLCAEVLLNYCRAVVLRLSSWDRAVIHFEKETTLILFAGFAVLCCLLFAYRKHKTRTLAFITAVFVFSFAIFSFSFDYVTKSKNVKICVSDVSDGLCVSVSQKGKSVLLFCECESYYSSFACDEVSNAVLAVVPNSEQASTALLSRYEPQTVAADEMQYLTKALRDANVEEFSEYTFCDVTVKLDGETVFIEAFGRTVAVTKEESTDADVIITNNEAYALDIDEKSVIILSGEYFCENAFSTGEYGDITINISKNAQVCVKGENSWQHLMKSS